MSDQEIYEKVEAFLTQTLSNTPFDKGLPVLQKYLWELGDEIGKPGTEVLRIYFDLKSKQK